MPFACGVIFLLNLASYTLLTPESVGTYTCVQGKTVSLLAVL